MMRMRTDLSLAFQVFCPVGAKTRHFASVLLLLLPSAVVKCVYCWNTENYFKIMPVKQIKISISILNVIDTFLSIPHPSLATTIRSQLILEVVRIETVVQKGFPEVVDGGSERYGLQRTHDRGAYLVLSGSLGDGDASSWMCSEQDWPQTPYTTYTRPSAFRLEGGRRVDPIVPDPVDQSLLTNHKT
uniref:Uncharacterized protein n=1 Tax=Timema bartmani TaxID=61472 RepID=A0A7R9I3R3_9NEOP|nr:unnamed protein product [Timema bartmani]